MWLKGWTTSAHACVPGRRVDVPEGNGWQRHVDPDYLNSLPAHWAAAQYRDGPPQDLSAIERAHVARGHAWRQAPGARAGYTHAQTTKPHTPAVALGDSPSGLAAWIPRSCAPGRTAFTIFPRDLVRAPREFAARFFDARSWIEEPVGGHSAAWELYGRYASGVVLLLRRTAIDLADGR
ncbi:hypothetical protein [Streptomyces sp. NPDC005799]|uniref:hypothetical protein n=1 Tax=Streptomyces sp. NPDC005799 TaxID=3154678 RepID=UPI0033EC4F49